MTVNKIIPYSIIGFFILFFIFIGQFVYRSTQANIPLVSKDYYQKEMTFQHLQEKKNRGEQYNLDMKVFPTGDVLHIQYPKALKGLKGVLNFYKPNNAASDFSTAINLDKDAEQLIDVSQLQKGKWQLSIDCQVGDKEYFFNKEFTLR